ncbi:aminotransferase class V-fold PLP-dependent enzyme [Mycoplasma sp. 1573]
MDYKKFFPMLQNNDIAYLDNGALGLKPEVVCQAGNDFYTKFSISTRTKDSRLGMEVSDIVNQTRQKVASFFEADWKKTIFYSGASEALNQVAMMLADLVNEGDEILLSLYNHASNVLPYFYFLKDKNVNFVYFTTQQDLMQKINKKTKIVALSQQTNNLNEKYELDSIYQACLKNDVYLVNDAAQAAPHTKVTIKNCDFIAVSANKMYGPTGLGVLCISDRVFSFVMPKKFGGGAAKSFSNPNYDMDYSAYEVGTLNLAGIYQFNKAIDFINEIGFDKMNEKMYSLSTKLHEKLTKVPNIILYSKPGDNICLFNIQNVSSQDVASYLGHRDIYVRSGTFCAYLLEIDPNFHGTMVRVSLAFYNDEKDIERLIEALINGGDFLDFI